ncbi:MAG: 3'(2'),5'-bisphosphate nucleotidase CysQ [Leptonema illini]|uniref:3'(2'),5'-bisphosphate nucleotidase CysQ n=1 Tax=Leptonema illini TaxID=183 RepID=A0A833H056_9LEPT|nr:MAG: 3'(2'),5'-bisphosphate nucleotidase CysQ [Leptonema illini]
MLPVDRERKELCESLLPGLIDAIQKAAAEVQRLFLSRSFAVSEKGPGDLLTSADLASNDILHNALTKLLPEAVWISEESAQSEARQSYRFAWIVDPIDGTKEFAGGIPEYSISVGLVADGLPILGAVALPAEGLLFAGGIDVGVFELHEKGRRRIQSTVTPALNEASILVSSTEFKKGVFEDAVFADLRLHPTGSVARKLALIAGGRGDANISLYPKNEWDICGGIALVLGAGGKALHLNLETLEWEAHRFNAASLLTYGLIAGSPDLVDALCKRQQEERWPVRREYGR